MIENLDLALKIKTQLEDYLTQLGYKEALVNIDEISTKASRELFEKHDLPQAYFSDLRGYYIYDECLIVKQLSDSIIGRLVGILEPLSVNKELSKFEVNIKHSSVDTLKTDILAKGKVIDVIEAATYYEIKPHYN